MTWDWDRGNADKGLGAIFGFRAEAGATKMSGRTISKVTAARNEEDAQLEALQANPAVLNLVRSRIKKSIGRTADIPIMCGHDWGQGAIAFGIVADRVELIRVYITRGLNDSSTWERTAFRLTGSDTQRTPVHFRCQHSAQGNEVELRRTRLWLFQQGIEALLHDRERRPKIQLHGT